MNILLDPSAHPVIGHRGNRAHAPENTIESFAQAVNAGAEAIEFDVHVTADGIPVVHHDPMVMRTTDGRGEIKRLTFDELKRFDAGARFTKDSGRTYPYRGHGHRIPRLDEVFEAFPSTPLLIEIKTALASVAVKNAIESHKAEERTVVDSFEGHALDVFHNSDIAYGATPGDCARLMKEVLLHSAITPPHYRSMCIPLNYRGLPIPVKRFARVLPPRGCTLHVWTINDPVVALDLWKAGVNGIITDDPGVMLKLREEKL